MNTSAAAKAAVIAVLSSGIVLGLAGSASAAPPSTNTNTNTNTQATTATTATTTAGSSSAPAASASSTNLPSTHLVTTVTPATTTSDGKTSYEIHFSNISPYTFTLTSVSGDNTGVPPIGSVLPANPDQHKNQPSEDFKVVFVAFKFNTVTATYTVTDQNGNNLGTATLYFGITNEWIPNTWVGTSPVPLGIVNADVNCPEVTTG